jgi:hypothetical protein
MREKLSYDGVIEILCMEMLQCRVEECVWTNLCCFEMLVRKCKSFKELLPQKLYFLNEFQLSQQGQQSQSSQQSKTKSTKIIKPTKLTTLTDRPINQSNPLTARSLPKWDALIFFRFPRRFCIHVIYSGIASVSHRQRTEKSLLMVSKCDWLKRRMVLKVRDERIRGYIKS